MANKNPFEIRAEVLQLAKEYMDAQQKLNLQLMSDLYREGQLQIQDLQKACQMYTIDELMEKAKEMYSFVSTKE